MPGVIVSAASGAIALTLMPDLSAIIPSLWILPYWMLAAAIIGCVYAYFTMMAARVPDPAARIAIFVRRDWPKLLIIVVGVLAAGINMTTFMWTKPLLNYLVPFRADPLLAAIDNRLFLGHDPWTLLTSMNTGLDAIFYHRAWFALMILALIIALAAPPSPRKSAVMMTYFLLWSVIGPVIHLLMPAAGPIFFANLGYGDRFAGLGSASETSEVATYLWTIYSGDGFGPGSGISAMPSLHIATSTWIMLVVVLFARRLVVPVGGACAWIFLLSIALGWHYASDGIVGAAATLLCYWALHSVYASRSRAHPEAALAPA
jgi:hypothetical protein